MQLFYAPEITLPEYTLSEEESKHCVRVLRMRVGDDLHITDGKGNMYRCKVLNDNAKHCTVEVVETIPEYEKMSYRLVMGVAPTKNIDRFEWFLEKATEVGITEVYPLECDHSERRQIKDEREEKVITSAVKQSLKAYHPTLAPLTRFAEFVRAPREGRKFIAHCAEPLREKHYLASTVKAGEQVTVLIGPEGDFSTEEIALAVEHGWEEITLGTQRLRTETAAVVAVGMVSVINNM